jgi:hypothetical protein
MIHYALQCRHGHPFDGWFRDSAAFDAQAAAGLVECPTCGETTVSRAMMAPAVGRKGGSRVRDEAAPPQAAPPTTEPGAAVVPAAVGGERLPDQVRAMLQRLRAEVERSFDYVGDGFADEARRIHRGESDKRGIYGETTPAQAEALADEGIEFDRIPWVPRAEG